MSIKSERLLKIYSLLKRGPVSVEILKHWAAKNDIKISDRTIYRDMINLENSLMLPDEKLVVSVGEKTKKSGKLNISQMPNHLMISISTVIFCSKIFFRFRWFLPEMHHWKKLRISFTELTAKASLKTLWSWQISRLAEPIFMKFQI